MWEILRKSYRASGFVHLTKSTTQHKFVLITYIVFLTKLQKKANPVKWICPY
jgi:hypothetical protein